jgi:tetratricopeptide (TPR) repeat protein
VSSLIEGYNYDIFISYRQKDNKYDGWVTEFVDNLKKELEATFKDEISVYFDINPHDGLLETHDVDASLKEKLKCLIFIPVISRTYCDPKSFAWEHEFKAFIESASRDQFGLKVKLPNGNVASRLLPVQIHDLRTEDKLTVEKELQGHLRAIEFIYREPGINKPLLSDDDEKKNLNNTRYRLQINKVANAIDEIISGLQGKASIPVGEKTHEKVAPGEGEVTREVGKGLKHHRFKRSDLRLIRSITIAVVLLAVVGILLYLRFFNASGEEDLEKSVALMSFRNLTGDVNNDYLADMHREALYQELGKLSMVEKSLTVVGPMTTSRIEKSRLAEYGQTGEIIVDYLVEGSVLSTGDSTEVIIRLVHLEQEEKFIWAKNFPVNTRNILNLHHNIAFQVAQGIGLGLESGDSLKILQPGIVNPQSYEAYSRGMQQLELSTDEGIKKGLDYLLEAVEISPDDPFANAGLALGYLTIAHSTLDPGDALAKGEELALKALKLDSTIAEVHAALAMAYLYKSWKYDESEKHFKRALELNPNLDMAHYHYSWGLLLWGRMDEAIKEHKLAQRYDPYNPLHTAWLGGEYVFAGRYQAAANEALNSFEIQKDYPIGYLVLGRAYLLMGRNEEAVRMHQRLAELYPNQTTPLCLTYVATGQLEEAEKLLAEIEKRPVTPLNAYNRARIYAKMGRKDEAFKWLAYEPHHSTVAWAAIIDDFEPLHGDSRWDEFLKRVNLPRK